MRQIVLDTETTGLEPENGHRIIEIGCVELNSRQPTGNNLHLYIQPGREVDPGAVEIHGITDEFLADKPAFEQISDQLMHYLTGAELIIHNAPFDLAFLDAEFLRIDPSRRPIADVWPVIDTLVDARERFPGQRNSLDALCKRFEVDNTGRELHGALLDARLLADVYRAMTGGQIDIALGEHKSTSEDAGQSADKALGTILEHAGRRPRVVTPTAGETAAHVAYIATLEARTGQTSAWRRADEGC